MKRILPEENMSWQRPILSISNNGTATKGNRYIVGDTPTGNFSGLSTDAIAWYDGDEWQVDIPDEGWIVYDLNQTELLVYMNGPSGDYWYYFRDIFGSTGSALTDANAIHDNVAGEINGITEKASPVSADLLLIEDSEDSNNKKKVQIGNLPGGSSEWTYIDKSSDETISSDNTFSDDSELKFTTLANTKYKIDIEFYLSTSAAADFKYQLVHAGTTTETLYSIYGLGAASAGATNAFSFGSPYVTAFSTAFTITSTSAILAVGRISIYLEVGASGGLFSFQWAQNTLNASNTTIEKGSNMKYRVIP